MRDKPETIDTADLKPFN